jgi:hypothetical protein
VVALPNVREPAAFDSGRRMLPLKGLRPALAAYFFYVLPPLFTVWALALAARSGNFAVDFHHEFWPAGRHVLHGESPFSSGTPDAVAHAASRGVAFVYPPLTAFLMAPFALLRVSVSEIVFTAVLLLAVFVSLWMLRVTDRRSYGVVLLWPPVFAGLQTGNLTLVLLACIAALWRWRDRSWAAGALAAVSVALKLFLWPLVIWLLATRRFAAATWAVLLTAGLTLASWGAVGFAGLGAYEQTVRSLTSLEQGAGYTLLAFGLKLGAGGAVAHTASLAAAVVALLLAVAAARRGNDAASFALTVTAALLLSPIVWLHYYALMLAPLAILRPRYSSIWLLPLLLWACPVRLAGPSWLAVLPVAIFVVLLAVAIRPSRRLGVPSRAQLST